MSLVRSMLPERLVQAEALLAVLVGFPGRQRGQHHRGERLVDLVEVEVLQGQPVAGEQPGYRVRGCHQQAVGPVDVVHRGGLAVDEVGQRFVSMRLRPSPRSTSSATEAPSVSGVELPAVMVASPALTPNTGLSLASFSGDWNQPAGCCPGTARGTG